jgi:Leucine-rich repeat (LRR) protein
MSENQISAIDEDAFEDLENLLIVTLSDNKLTSVPENLFAKNFKLEGVSFDSNLLKTLDPQIFRNNHNIFSLTLTDNKFTTFSREILSPFSQAMVYFSLESNQISSLDSRWFKDCEKIDIISFANNKITEIPNDFLNASTKLQKFSIGNNQINVIDFKIFENKKSLFLTADFKNNPIVEVRNLDVIDSIPEMHLFEFGNAADSCIKGSFASNKEELKKAVKKNCKGVH